MSKNTGNAAAAVERVVTQAYAVIFGPKGAERDWDTMRAMYLPGARMTAMRPDGIEICTVERYIAGKRDFLTQNGFSESTLVNRIEIYGDMAHVWSSYSGDWIEPEGNPGRTRGINSFQLRRDEEGNWRIHSLLWQVETPDLPLPTDMDATR
ncbi:hypothetical protein [Qipengyuania qiaonensis]|uniref:DUF4440 domain-containing protein n=1 Tax=Qipengyuania qiaonensis TaxID=2867240 RepID=A0ABS7J2K1_9SPHN|nr:hypothetical protein [Qipengyuania qiaonensis]MBX7481541.1 hypothetical protein [Qipengyuania qiaonensis]